MAGWAGGVFTRARNWAQDKLNGINPQAALFDQEDDNFASGLNNCVTKDGLNKPSATMDFNTQRLTALGDATGATDALNRQTADARYSLGAVVTAVKTATTSRNTTTVLADDPHLVAALAAGTYAFDLWMPFWATTATGMGIKLTLAFSGTSTLALYSDHGYVVPPQTDLVSTFGTNRLIGSIVVSAGANSFDWLRLTGVITVTVAGNISLQWAQNSSNANNLNVGIGAWFKARKVA